MPELPEVETIRRGLEGRLIDRSILEIDILAPKLFEGKSEYILSVPLLRIDRQGKLLVMYFEGGYVLTIHLKMTGQLLWKPGPKPEVEEEIIDNATASFESDDDEEDDDDSIMGGHPEKSYLDPLPHKHTHVIIRFDDGSTLYFNDLRKFGRMKVLSMEELEGVTFLQTLGPEPFSPEFSAPYLDERLKKRPKQPIKSFLLDQTNIAGLGNIYADESLFRASILPDRITGSLTEGEIANLYNAIEETVGLALQYGGSSSRDYVNAVGEKGTFLKIANVYHRQGEDCNRCDTGVIVRKKIGGRSSHYCPVCQY